MIKKIEVVPHDPNWCNLFETESKQIAVALGENAIAIHHIGSTSIETIYAKPIIDILIEVSSISKVYETNSQMETLGYRCMGEFRIRERRLFSKDNRVRNRHVHVVYVFDTNSAQISRYLAFRDYLNVHLEDAQSYSVLKQSLANKYPYDIERYMDGTHDFIQEIDRKAAEWQRKQSI